MSLLQRLLDPDHPLTPPSSEVQDAAYHAALASERTRVLRRRLLWYCAIAAVGLAVSLLFNLATLIFRWDSSVAARAGTRVDVISDFVLISTFGAAALLIRTQRPDHAGLVNILRRLWAVAGGIVLLTQPLANYLNLGPDNPAISNDEMTLLIGLSALASVFVLHFVGSLIIPLTWREALTPVVLLWVTFAVVAVILYPHGHWALRTLLILLFPLVGAPGVLWSWRSYNLLGERFHTRVLGERYGELKSELQYARRIHEALFPPELATGPVQVRYWYEPMREIGGDFLYIHPQPQDQAPRDPASPVTVVLIDVSGHGVPAALAVNRLHGEIQRYLAENPAASPGDLVEDLNAYAHAALASQGMFATAIAIQIDPASRRLAWASAGHPPGAVRPAKGGMDYLDSTCTMLGVLPTDLFHADQRETTLADGDRVLLFTDGAMDVRSEASDQLGLEELRRALLPVRSSTDDPLDGARRRITHHRGRAPLADDCLVVQITFHAPATAALPALTRPAALPA